MAVGPLISGATGSALDESIRKSEELLNETKRAEEVVNLRLKELETQETNRAIAREKQQRTQIHLQEIREAKSRAESDTRALHVELNSLEKQEILMQSEINQQIALQSRLVDELPQLEDHEAQSIERTKAMRKPETRIRNARHRTWSEAI